jgi:tRNA A37 threonylcarbamoyladenosine synthetase subunit TsaC/SUA5/YrdC
LSLFDLEADARRAFDALKAGGIAIVPNDIGYSILGGSGPALRRIFETKGRAASKLNAMVGNAEIHRELHICSQRGRDIVAAITGDYDLPLGCIAPCRIDHPLLRALPADTLAASTRDNTLVMLLNRSLSGTKFAVEAIEPEIKAIADVIIDHGLQKYHVYAASSTLLNLETLEVVRVGSCYESIRYILERHFGVTLSPANPARD